MLRRILDLPVLAGAVVVSVMGLLVALFQLDARSLWFDEAMSVRAAHLPREQFLKFAFEQEAFSALYYGILRGWLKIDDTIFLVRLPSAIFAAGAVGITFLIGRRLLGPAAGWVAALLLAVHALHLQYAQEARTYALAELSVTAATWMFLVALDRNRWWAWLAYAALVIVAVHAHFFAVMVVAAHALAFLLRSGERPWVGAVGAWSVAAIASWPLASWLLSNDQTRGWIPALSLIRLLNVLGWLGGANAFSSPAAVRLFAVATGLALVAAAVVAARMWRNRTEERWPWLLLLGWVLVPIVGGAIVSVVVKPVLAERYLLIVLPGLALLVAGLLVRARPGVMRVAAVLATVGILAVGTFTVTGSEMKKPAFDEAVAYLAAEDRPGDALITEPGWQWVPLEYAMTQVPERPTLTRVVTNPAIEPPEDTMERLEEGYERVWLVVVDGHARPEPHAYGYLHLLERSYHLVDSRVVHLVGVFLYERSP